MAKKIMIASGKGGVGKSTITTLIGRRLGAEGQRVLLIDGDAGLGGLDTMLGAGDEAQVYNWYDITNGNCKIEDVITIKDKNLWFLASPKTYHADISVEKFSETLLPIMDKNFDYVLIDSPAGLGRGIDRAASLADRAVIVITPDNVSADAARALTARLETLGITETRLIINRFRKKATLRGSYLNIDNCIDKSGIRLLGIVPEDYGLQHLSQNGEQGHTKKSTEEALLRITKRFRGENPKLDLKKFK